MTMSCSLYTLSFTVCLAASNGHRCHPSATGHPSVARPLPFCYCTRTSTATAATLPLPVTLLLPAALLLLYPRTSSTDIACKGWHIQDVVLSCIRPTFTVLEPLFSLFSLITELPLFIQMNCTGWGLMHVLKTRSKSRRTASCSRCHLRRGRPPCTP